MTWSKIGKLSLILIILDVIFLYLNKEMFKEQLFLVQKTESLMKPLGGILTYFFIILLLFRFIIKENKTPFDAFILGLCTYGIYEYTTYTLLNEWKLQTTIMDTLWGGTLFALTTYIYQL
jgi:uncharacterized membrane protein